MTTTMPITQEEFLKRYAESNRKDPNAGIRLVMWLMIYDDKPSSWARDFFEENGVLTQPENDAARKSQLQKVRRWRNAAEETVRLPPRGKRGTTTDYKLALQEWKRINPRPTDEELLAGWTPQPLPLPDTTPKLEATESSPTRIAVVETRPRTESPTPTTTPTDSAETPNGSSTGRLTAEALLELSRREEENQRRPPEKKTERKPTPFRAPPPPPLNATKEEREVYAALRKQALDDYKTEQRGEGWEIPADWDGFGSLDKVAKWVGPD